MTEEEKEEYYREVREVIRERREERRRRAEERKKERRRRLEEKYTNLEKKLDSGFSSEMEEAMAGNGSDVTVNPMLYRPYSLLRYVIKSARELSSRPYSRVFDMLERGLVGCGANYDNLGYSWDLYENRQLEAGLKVILRHIKYGPSELDDVYCLDEWSRYFKYYNNSVVRSSSLNTEFLSFFENNSELKEYLENVEESNERDPREIFDRVHRNLAESTFNLISLRKVRRLKFSSQLLNEQLHMMRDGDRTSSGLSLALYEKLFDYVDGGRFDTFNDFTEQGVSKFFSFWLSNYDWIAAEVIEKHNKRLEERNKVMMEKAEERKKREEEERKKREGEQIRKLLQEHFGDEDSTSVDSQDTGVLKPTSMFGSSEEESSTPMSTQDEEVLKPVNNEDPFNSVDTKEDPFNSKENEIDWENTPKRPVRTDVLEEGSLEDQLKVNLEKAEEFNREIETLQEEIKDLESSLEDKKDRLKTRLIQEEVLWDKIEEMQRKLK